ncbi:hypothetical protein AC1031_011642 [Aphanomyces cochlioides]|nr:hypothetical protein AC1031_011642 [Aphanomyces cochlioides]
MGNPAWNRQLVLGLLWLVGMFPNVNIVSSLAWLIALSATGVVAEATTCSPVIEDMDYPGNDVAQTNRANHADCCNDCTNTAGCNLYVWTSWNGGTCFLKSSPKTAGGETPQPGARSARISPVQQSQCSQVVGGVDYPGNDLSETNRANHADCCNDCAVTSGCAAYVWTSLNGGTCFLKSKAGEAQILPGAKAATWAPLTTTPTTPSPVITTPAPTPVATRSVVCLETVQGYDSWIPVTIDSNGDVAAYGLFGVSYSECMIPRDWPYVELRVSCGCDFKTKYPEFGFTGYDFGADFWCNTGKAYFNANPPGGTCAPIVTPSPSPTPRPKQTLPPKPTTSPPPPLKCFNTTKDVKFAGINITETSRASHTDCCNDCAQTLGCALYVWNLGTCYLKSKPKKSDTSSGNSHIQGHGAPKSSVSLGNNRFHLQSFVNAGIQPPLAVLATTLPKQIDPTTWIAAATARAHQTAFLSMEG